MDTFAAGLLVAAKMHEDKFIQNLQAERYASYDSGIGATIEDGTATLASLEEYALDIPQAKLIEATKVGSSRVRQGHDQQLHHRRPRERDDAGPRAVPNGERHRPDMR